jgi:hypothetical protein
MDALCSVAWMNTKKLRILEAKLRRTELAADHMYRVAALASRLL